MGRRISQIWLLTKKNFILQIRRPVGALVELLLPCVFLGLISLIRLSSPIEDHCFSYFNPLKPQKFNTKYEQFAVVGMAPDNTYSSTIATCMSENQDILNGYKVVKFSEEEIKSVVASLDFSDPVELAKKLAELAMKYKSKKIIALVPTIQVLQDTLVQNAEFFNAAVELDTSSSDTVNYTLGLQTNVAERGRWYNERTYPYYFEPGPVTFRGYDQGWISLQQVIDRCVLLDAAVDKEDIPVVSLRQMPYPVWQEDSFSNAIRNSLPLMIVISFLWIGASISKELVGEKASRMKETMKMMGLSNWILWLSWIIQRVVLMLVTVFLMVLVMKLARYVINTNAVILYLFLFEYAISVMCFCFFLSTLFSKTTTAIAGTMLGYFLLYIPYFFLGNEFDNMTDDQRYLSCLLSSTCMGFGANIISKWETMEEGLQFGNVAKQTSDLDTFTMGDVMLMLFVDIIIYSLMTWYVEAVFPGDYGIKQKPWFFFTREYWCGSRVQPQKNETVLSNSYNVEEGGQGDQVELSVKGVTNCETLVDANGHEVEDEHEMGQRDAAGEHEKGPRDKNVGIAIHGLVKRFNTPKGKMTAVDGLTLDMYEDQITSLLGHNGAGKTTTMSMLTGLFSPSDGDAYVNGHSILTSMDKVRESLGMCPQHNVLFDRLTVNEHLDFFIRLKGYQGDVDAEATKMMKMLKLSDKMNAKSDELSGGMKRKLSVGIALSGGSKVIILDEPTAGMDPYARRATWDLILQNKKDRTILLTTHYMDEADFLGDRIAIMATGKLVCSGSSMFLKKKHGVGYHLTLVKTPSSHVQAVEKFVKSHVSTAKKISDVGSELVYILPENEVDNFVPLFKKLEDGETGDHVDIESFGLSLTTLEEVFMKVGESEEDKNVEAVAEKDGNATQFKVFKPEELNSGATLLAQQLRAMICKRFINTKRYKKGIIVQLVLPIIFAVLGLVLVKTLPSADSEPARYITLTDYPGNDEKGTAFLADTTYPIDDTNIDDYFTPPVKEYLEEVNLYSESLRAAVDTDKEKYSKAKYTDTATCCTEPALQLAAVCTDKGDSRTDWKYCEEDTSWGYKPCFDKCFDPIVAVNETCGNRPLPLPKYMSDDLSYFTNVFLDQIQGDVRFYRKKQVAYTYSEVPKSIVYLVDNKNASLTTWNDITDKQADFILGSLNPTIAKQNVLTGWYSHEGLHLAPGVQNAMSNLLLVRAGQKKRISVWNKPLPKSLLDQFSGAGASGAGASLSIMMLLGFSFLTSSFVLFVVEERENKSKHLQQISGVNGGVYWFGTLIWDLINYIACILVITILFAVFNIEGLNGGQVGAVFVLLLMYGYCSIPFVYMCSLAFKSPVSAYSIIVTFTFISGLAGYIANLILTLQEDDFQPTLEKIMLILPNFCFIQGLTNIYGNGIQKSIWKTCTGLLTEAACKQFGLSETNVFEIEGKGLTIGTELIALFVVGTAAFLFVLIQEIFGKTVSLLINQKASTVKAADMVLPDGEDDDVQSERTRVMCELQKLTKETSVVFTNLRKCYGKKVAVQNLTLGIPKNECFGLLGVNGAGKTTTFSMLTGDISMTGGEAYIAGYNLRTDIRKIQQRIGYCPQFDALIGIMTGRELLRMFANMRGIPSAEIEQTVNEAIRNLNLDVHADKLCGSYSGGNKRKLSTAIALVGNPEVLFLDEPTAGMDPTARRFLWTVLADLTAANIGTSIVLTTHSMEECEALCNRLVIMVNGAFRCLGSIQHLKSKYGDGYTITMTMDEEKQDECSSFIDTHFPGALLKEEHLGYLHYELTSEVKWSFIFEKMEQNKTKLEIEDYAVNQTSLEQVFLNFAKDQSAEEDGTKKKEKERKCCACLGGSSTTAVESTEYNPEYNPESGRKFSRVSVQRRASSLRLGSAYSESV